jgi:AcrR family transcriptional regulator
VAQARQVVHQRGEEDTRARLLAVAAGCFARHGYAAASIRDIAGAVGVTVGAVYVHFRSKDRLLVAVYEAGVRRIGEAVDAAVAGESDPWERLKAAACAHLEALIEDDSFARVIVRVIPRDVPEAARDLRRLRDGYEVRFRALVDALDLARGLDRTLLRLHLLGALNATQTWYRKGGGGADAGRIAAQIVAVLRGGAAAGAEA